jgi:hypothetical protein
VFAIGADAGGIHYLLRDLQQGQSRYGYPGCPGDFNVGATRAWDKKLHTMRTDCATLSADAG